MSITATARQYVASFDYGDGEQMIVCTTDRMRGAVEDAAYSGEEDDARYFTIIDGEMTEVTFRAVAGSNYCDEDDYLHTTYHVFRKTGDTQTPIDAFYVRIDGRS